MDLKRGKIFVGAVVAISLGSFAMPLGSIAGASTGPSTGIVRSSHDAGRFIQLAEEERQVEEKSEHKVTESSDSTVAPGTAVVAPGTTVVAPGTTVVVPESTIAKPDTAEKHSESKSVDKEKDINVLGMHAKVQHHVDESNSNAQSDSGATAEHEEHEMNKVEHN
jgi:hypothetical protein